MSQAPQDARRFDRERLESRLAELPALHRVAFCAAICERLLPNYAGFVTETGWGDTALLRRGLDLGWAYANGEHFSRDEILGLQEAVRDVIPESEDHESPLTAAAIDASAAVYETLGCCVSPDPWVCATVAAYACDSVDLYIQMRDDLHHGAESFEERIASDPLMQQELERQEADLLLLSSASSLDPALLDVIRAGARSNLT